MKAKKNIFFKNLQIRSSEFNGKKFVEGIIPYNSRSVPMWGMTEIIDKTAFNKTLSDKNEVRALWNHDDTFILGNTKSGTLILENADDGLICRCELPNTTYANDLFEIIERGDVKTMSFGFIPIKWVDTENNKSRTLKEVALQEVSFGVPYAAYPDTDSQAFIRKNIMKRTIDIENLNEILEKETLTEDELTQLKEFVSLINEIIEKNKSETEEEAAETEEQSRDTPDNDTSKEPEEENQKEENQKEEIKQELLILIDTLFEIENEELNEEKK